MTLAIFWAPAVRPLPPGCLPAMNFAHAIRLLAVPLVPAEWLVDLLAALAETDPWPLATIASGRTTLIQSTMVLSHGSWFPSGPARGGSDQLPRALLCYGDSLPGIHAPINLSV